MNAWPDKATITDKNVIIQPASGLAQASDYKVKVTTGLSDLGGNFVSSNYVSSSGFRTYNKPSQINFTTTGATYPNNGGNKSSGQYFAQPFRPSSTLNINYAAIPFSKSNLSRVYIYSSTGTGCNTNEQMGTVDCNPDSVISSATEIGNDYFDELTSTTGSLIQAYFGSSPVMLSANTTYFIVVRYDANVQMSIDECSQSLAVAGRRYSVDGSTWLAWSGGSNCTNPIRPAQLFLGSWDNRYLSIPVVTLYQLVWRWRLGQSRVVI